MCLCVGIYLFLKVPRAIGRILRACAEPVGVNLRMRIARRKYKICACAQELIKFRFISITRSVHHEDPALHFSCSFGCRQCHYIAATLLR